MPIFSLYLDSRRFQDGKPVPIKLRFTKERKSAYVPTEISVLPSQWDIESQMVVSHPRARMMNMQLLACIEDAERIFKERRAEFVPLSASDVVKRIKAAMYFEELPKEDKFLPCYLKFMDKKEKKRTREIYHETLQKIKAYCNVEELCFSDITVDWLYSFEKFLMKTSPSANARSIHFRNIRAVFNDAIDDEVTSHYPFRKFKIKKEATIKRSLTVEQLARLFSTPVSQDEQKYMDMMKLTFYLIGINLVDLCNLKSIQSGRVNYHRAKTNRLYSIKVEPEAEEIIEKYRGKEYLLYMNEHYKDYRAFNRLINLSFHRLGVVLDKGKRDKVFSDVTTYWMRHTWATLAAELEIPKETIAAALGHGGNDVTDIYIRFDQRKVDRANRQVIDYVNEAIEKLKGRE